MIPGASLRVYVSPASRQNPPPVDLPAPSPWPAPPRVTEEAASSPPGIKDPPASAVERCRDVLPLPLASMFTGRVGRPKTIEGGK